ncbi:hypothetical protein [Bacillus sp. AG4(2022)]|uniref:hypothetical protein n=1 Tax=Bacillus sp. AG4(2022) TaxID=2962594 RepID=UPI002880F3F2|nr:hypothetical protein [Bacillus sp. AG4(2022)]MDT0160402.1 hypothetical protein [Bacillus sp. AG4(2022)]
MIPRRNRDISIDVVKNENGYMFTLPSLGYSSGTYYKINGEKVKGSASYTSEIEPLIEIFDTTTVKVKAKSLIEGQSDLTIAEYDEKKAKLESKKVWDQFNEYKIFDNLEDEFEYKKFVRDYKIITKMEEELVQTLELNIQEKVESDNPYIKLHRHIGKGITSQAATYDRWSFYKYYTRKLLKDKGFEELDSSISKKNTYKIYQYNEGMVNLYAEGKQIFDTNVRSFSDELEIVEKKYKEDKEWIEEKVSAFIKNSRNLPSVQDIISKMNGILKQVQKIDPKVKTIDEYNAAVRWIKDLINDLEKGNYSK